MRKIVAFILLLGLLPIMSVTGQISSGNETSIQCSKHVRYVKWTKKTSKRRSIPLDTDIEAYAVDNILTIFFTAPPANEYAVIIVSNEEGEIIYENNIIITDIMDILLDLNGEEDYSLEIYSRTSYCLGCF